MSTVKISELPVIPALNSDTTKTLLPAVDVATEITGRLTAKVLAASLYSNDVLNVGNTAVILPNVVAQFADSSDNYVQINLQNSSGNGSSDYVITADTGDDSSYYIDMGYNGSTYNYDGYTYARALDGYLVVQGSDNLSPGGNLVIGTTTPGKDVSILVGSIDESKIMSKFVANTGFKMVQYPVIFADGTTQNTAAATIAHTESNYGKTNAAFIAANSAGGYANTAYYKANVVGSYANAAFTQANAAVDFSVTGIANASAADGKAAAAFVKANNALANTSGTFGGSLVITGTANVRSNMMVSNSTYDYTNTALVKIVGSTGAFYQPPANPGYMLSITGVDGVASRVINSSYGTGAYALFAGRKGNGTAETPTAVANNDVIARFSGSGYNGSAFTSTGQGRIDIVAAQNFTTANNGSRIEFYNTPNGANTVTQIAAFNAESAHFLGTLVPAKGFAYTPNNITTPSTAYSLDFQRDSMIRMTVNDNSTITLSNYTNGKVVEVWITNSANQNKTITHGCLANNSTVRSTSFTIQASACAFLKYFSIDGDNANTYVSITA